jgi:hypothetical protein
MASRGTVPRSIVAGLERVLELLDGDNVEAARASVESLLTLLARR